MNQVQKIVVGLWIGLLAMVLWAPGLEAQEPSDQWSSIQRLSTAEGKASESYMAADRYGYVHVFWTEDLADDRTIIQYARFDGETWSTPFDIYVSKPFAGIGNVSPVIDNHDTVHLVWTEGNNGPAYYTFASILDSSSAKNWAQPLRIEIPAKNIALGIDSKGVHHVLYTSLVDLAPGVYYVRSDNQWITWSDPVRLDPDIPPNMAPGSLQFALDDADGLHAVWYYIALDLSGGDWVRYAHSLDGGHTWSLPFTIDKLDQHGVERGNTDDRSQGGGGSDYTLDAARPVLITQGQTVHIIWAGGELHFRHHRFSTDRGQTWGVPVQIMNDLNGQAGDGLAVDGVGRVHFFSQIRYPMGIWHAYWDDDHWTPPSLVYFISNGPEGFGDHIHAHRTFPIVRAGNQLLLTFTDPPGEAERRLFAMYRTLNDIPAVEIVPTPVPTATPVPQHSPTPTPSEPTSIATPIPLSFETELDEPQANQLPAPGRALWLGFIPPLVLVGGTIAFWLFLRRKY